MSVNCTDRSDHRRLVRALKAFRWGYLDWTLRMKTKLLLTTWVPEWHKASCGVCGLNLQVVLICVGMVVSGILSSVLCLWCIVVIGFGWMCAGFWNCFINSRTWFGVWFARVQHLRDFELPRTKTGMMCICNERDRYCMNGKFFFFWQFLCKLILIIFLAYYFFFKISGRGHIWWDDKPRQMWSLWTAKWAKCRHVYWIQAR